MWANVDHSASLGATATTNIWFGVGAPAARFIWPDLAQPARADNLWQSTCFEAFLRADGEQGYQEWNFAPSGNWSAFDFAGYRERIGDSVTVPPYVRTEDNLTWWALGATIVTDAERRWSLGLSAVLEEVDGTKSYWALAHPAAPSPDFHDPACFAARLA